MEHQDSFKWAKKAHRALNEVVDLKKRMEILKSLIQEVDEAQLDEELSSNVCRYLNGLVEQTEQEIKGDTLRGLDYLFWQEELLSKAVSEEFIEKYRRMDTRQDYDWRELLRLVFLISLVKIDDEIQKLLFNCEQPKLYSLLKDKFVIPYKDVHNELFDIMKKEGIGYGTESKDSPLWRKAVGYLGNILDELFVFIDRLEPSPEEHQRLDAKHEPTRGANHPNEVIDYYSNVKEPEEVKNWIDQESYYLFLNIERELLDQGILDAKYMWKKPFVRLKDLSVFLIDHHKVFRYVVNGNKAKAFRYRQFLSERYGLGKTKLNESTKKYKPTVDKAKVCFTWIDKVSVRKTDRKTDSKDD